MENNNSTIYVNRDILIGKLGLRQYRNTIVYTKYEVFGLCNNPIITEFI